MSSSITTNSIKVSNRQDVKKKLNVFFFKSGTVLILKVCSYLITGIIGSIFFYKIFHTNLSFDDAYMYIRYANNFINTGKLSWNPGGEQVYGCTSFLYLMLIIIIRFVLSLENTVTMKLGATISRLSTVLIIILISSR